LAHWDKTLFDRPLRKKSPSPPFARPATPLPHPTPGAGPGGRSQKTADEKILGRSKTADEKILADEKWPNAVHKAVNAPRRDFPEQCSTWNRKTLPRGADALLQGVS